MNIDLSNTHILVTGASRGIGAAIAKALGQSGARVAVHCHSRLDAARKVSEAAGNGSYALTGDLADPAAVRRVFEMSGSMGGPVDVLVNNAAIALMTDFDAGDEEILADWDRTIAVNLRATDLLSRLAIRQFRERKVPGRLIHVASRAAFRGDTPEYLTYAASKAGVVALSRSYARAFGKDGICSFVIAPGFVRTDMAQDFIDEYGEEYVVSDLALDRLTEPSDVAPIAVLLASGLADHATGTSIDVNAGSYVR